MPTAFLQALVVAIGIAALAFLLWEPHLEGRNAHATLVEVYFHDPFLAYAYLASIPFFIVLWQTFTVIGAAGRQALASAPVGAALRTIRSCALAMIGFVVLGEAFLLPHAGDDRPQALMLGLLIACGAAAIAAAAAMVERAARKAAR